ncbi:uncharacterized protein LOC141683086 [Apium graveolens]|uniref:uncharacterized protein LOC141683086 n=1 Tax=Apium graveolens TaxID=4045 RepID=UPI003D7A2602
MEEKTNVVMEHPGHDHLLILNENYIAKKGDVCRGCCEEIDSCESSFIYSCINLTSTASTSNSGVKYLCAIFLLHKTCAELPREIVNPTDPNEVLSFHSWVRPRYENCTICGLWRRRTYFTYRSSFNPKICVCVKCAGIQVQQSKEDTIFVHPGHSHPLALIEQLSSFRCCACKVIDNILASSYRCTKCQFWIHKSCGDAPPSFQFQFHKHPLILSFSLPKVYLKFYQFCRICHERLYWIEWLYCCRSCRYFTHFQCARSRSSLLSSGENETFPNLVHLPAADELSLNLLLEQFIKDKIILSDSSNNSSISGATNYIKHWSHEEHDLKLITTDELYDRKNDDEILLLCDGCVEPVRTCDSQIYACLPCKYFMHKFCAEFPGEIEHHLWPGKTLVAYMYSESFEVFYCDGCAIYSNGIFFSMILPNERRTIRLHIGCVTLPEVIKHEAHSHQLQLHQDTKHACNACGYKYVECKYECKDCRFNICGACIRMVKTYKNRWDPHPLHLIYDAGMVEKHEHEFDCEFCSQEINTNRWFYHCSKCDLSFHTYCILKSSDRYYNVKFGATDIIKDKVHPHGLTFVFNKKVRPCRNCKEESRGKTVLQCAPCNSTIFCQCWGKWCWE